MENSERDGNTLKIILLSPTLVLLLLKSQSPGQWLLSSFLPLHPPLHSALWPLALTSHHVFVSAQPGTTGSLTSALERVLEEWETDTQEVTMQRGKQAPGDRD